MSINWRMDKEDVVIYTMENYLAMRKNETWPFVATWMELESVMLSEISQAEKDIWFHSYVEFEKLNRSPWGKGWGRNSFKQRGRQTHIRLLNTENKLRIDGGGRGEGKLGDGHWGGHFLEWALDVACKRWITGIYPWNQEHMPLMRSETHKHDVHLCAENRKRNQ